MADVRNALADHVILEALDYREAGGGWRYCGRSWEAVAERMRAVFGEDRGDKQWAVICNKAYRESDAAEVR